jgi:hypothetical protein
LSGEALLYRPSTIKSISILPRTLNFCPSFSATGHPGTVKFCICPLPPTYPNIAVSAAVVVGAMHLLATSWAMLGALGFVEFELGGEL